MLIIDGIILLMTAFGTGAFLKISVVLFFINKSPLFIIESQKTGFKPPVSAILLNLACLVNKHHKGFLQISTERFYYLDIIIFE